MSVGHTPHATLDATGLFCPLPIIKTAEKIRDIALGEVLEILATDFGILEDMPAWCKAMGHEYLGTEVDNNLYRSYVRRSK
jgi:TusA-related sulfurtransferase